jgi:hypothetical protein
MFRRMDKFDDAPSSEENGNEVAHDTPGLMFAYARRSAEKAFGSNSIYM